MLYSRPLLSSFLTSRAFYNVLSFIFFLFLSHSLSLLLLQPRLSLSFSHSLNLVPLPHPTSHHHITYFSATFSATKCLPLEFSLCISLALTSVSLSFSLYLVFSFWDVIKHRLILFWVLEKDYTISEELSFIYYVNFGDTVTRLIVRILILWFMDRVI